MSSLDSVHQPARNRAFVLVVISLAVGTLPVHAALRPITAFCFKTIGDNQVCACASKRLAERVSAASLQQYENLITLALAQTNVRRASAWQTALNHQATASGTSLAQVKVQTEATGRKHHLAVRQCASMSEQAKEKN